MAGITGLPHGAIASVAEELGVSRSLVEKVANGERKNVLIETKLLMYKNDYDNRMARIRRLKEKMKQYRFGEIDTSK